MTTYTALRPYLNDIRMPQNDDRIYKDECVFSFDTPESETGLYVCLKTFIGLGRDYVEDYQRKTCNSVFLHLRKIKREIPKTDVGDCEGQPKKITKLAIGVEGGFTDESQPQFEYEEINTVVILPGFKVVSLEDADIPDQVITSVSAILAADPAGKLEELSSLAGTWDGEKRNVSKHASGLPQLPVDKKIPPRGWKCDQCDLRDNLWLNLTDGSILCGRKFFDGSGGNNHALDHYKEVKHPLAVKLGTITTSSADVYSYDEDDMVEDPFLEQHLKHFGINIAQLEKSEKSMLELEIEMNQKIGEWSIITESDAQLVPLFGPGYTGLFNLGNSCYLNSVIQVLFTIPEFQNRFYPPNAIFANSPADPAQDFNTQMAKLANGLLSGLYSKEPVTGPKQQEGIKPNMFKNLVGKGHPEFSTKRQQDAQEFFLHLINMVDRNSRLSGGDNPTQSLSFQVEERTECVSSHKVNYTTRTEYLLPLPVPLDKATNLKEYTEFEERRKLLEIAGERVEAKDIVRARIPLETCIDAFAADDIVEDFFSTAINGKTIAKKSSRLKTFPDFLMLQLKKFTLGDDWSPKKLDIAVDVPDLLDLARIRGNGLQPGEESLPEQQSRDNEDSGSGNSSSTTSSITFDASVLSQLTDMGFSIDACKRALYSTQNTGAEAAVGWLFEHNSDQDFNDPFTLDQPSASGQSSTGFVPSPDGIEMLKAMGLSEEHAKRGLQETNNNVERAIDWIFNHPEELSSGGGGSAMETDEGAAGGSLSAEASAASFRDGSEKYKLVAFISHMGTSTMCGHYVCHILKDDKWVIFNDNKVAVSEHPPKELAYLYLYRRI